MAPGVGMPAAFRPSEMATSVLAPSSRAALGQWPAVLCSNAPALQFFLIHDRAVDCIDRLLNLSDCLNCFRKSSNRSCDDFGPRATRVDESLARASKILKMLIRHRTTPKY